MNANQLLEELAEFCQAGDDKSVRGVFIENLNPSSVVIAKNIDLTKLLWTSSELASPGIDDEELR